MGGRPLLVAPSNSIESRACKLNHRTTTLACMNRSYSYACVIDTKAFIEVELLAGELEKDSMLVFFFKELIEFWIVVTRPSMRLDSKQLDFKIVCY